MTDVSSWSPTDSSNNSSPPAGWPEGQNPSSVNDCARAMMGGQRRSWERTNATVLTTGASGTYTYTPANASFPTAYVNGEIFTFRAHQDSAGNDVINVNALGAKNLYVFVNTGVITIQAHQIKSGQIVQAMYDSTLNSAAGGFQVLGAVPRSLSPGDNSGSWTAGSVAFAAGINSLTQDNANFFWDSTNHRLGIGNTAPQGPIQVTGQQSIFGNAAGNRVSPTAANTNLLLYFNSSTNYAGIGAHTDGTMYFVTGVSAPATRFYIDTSGAAVFVGSLTGPTITCSGTLTGATVTCSGTLTGSTINATTQYNIAGGAFAINEGGYNKIIDTGPGGAIYLGRTGDAQNYYRQTTHTFQSIGGGTTFGTISAAGAVVNVGTLTVNAGNCNISGLYLISGTQITTSALSDTTAPTAWTPTDASGAGLTLTVTDAKYTKIGKLVVVSAFITWPANANGLPAKIGGLPVTAAAGTNPTGGGISTNGGPPSGFTIVLSVTPGNTTASILDTDKNVLQNTTLGNLGFGFTLMYLSA